MKKEFIKVNTDSIKVHSTTLKDRAVLPNPIKVVKTEIPEGLKQTFKLANGKTSELHKGLKEGDWWTTTGKVKKTILTHGAVQKLADAAGVTKDPVYTILTQPDAMNNYQYTIQAKVCTIKGECATEIGEANRNNLGSKGRGNPANMAQKRAYDRAVLRLLGINGLLSEEELQDNEEEESKMDTLSHEERKAIAPLLNKLLLAKTKEHLASFNTEMKAKSKEFLPVQVDYIRKLYQKKVGEITKVSF